MKLNRRVYVLVSHIPPGKVLTYGRVAALLEIPDGARTVGEMMHQLGQDTDVPWQRVINAQGRISIKDPIGAQEQRRRLESEGVRFDSNGRVKLEGPGGIMWLPSQWEVLDILETAERSETP
jgi:methylated-DNA-protein-cysteine methyltransferase related protein